MIQETDSIVFCSEQKQAWTNVKGQHHREDGPSFICPDGTRYWFEHGQLHRLHGPAVIFPDGVQYWYLDGNKVTREEAER